MSKQAHEYRFEFQMNMSFSEFPILPNDMTVYIHKQQSCSANEHLF